MKAINIYDCYCTFSIDRIGRSALYELIKEALALSNKVLIDEKLYCSEEPKYTTQFPFYSGFIQDRFAYEINNELIDYIHMELMEEDVYERFFCEYTCWDFYQGHTSLLSINIVLGIVSVNAHVLDIEKYGLEFGL